MDSHIFTFIFLFFQRQYGPHGFRPPTCGGPGSGYVCCKVGTNPSGQTIFVPANSNSFQTSPSNINTVGFGNNNANNFNNFNSQNNFNNNNNNRFNTLGQCGRRNAYGINGRIAANKFSQDDGNTEFGK